MCNVYLIYDEHSLKLDTYIENNIRNIQMYDYI